MSTKILHACERNTYTGQGRDQVTKSRYKIKVDIDVKSFDPMTSPNLAFDAGQVKVTSNFQIQFFFCTKRQMFLAQNFLRTINMSLVVLYDA